jgi:hypothetical protein
MANHIAINTTSASIPQQLQATQPLVPEQWRRSSTATTSDMHILIQTTPPWPPSCLQHFGDSHHCNASTSGATQPPPELCSHRRCYAVTTGVAQPPLVIPILSFLLSLQHFQHTTNSCHCNPTTSGAAQPPVISPLPFHRHPRCSQLI